MPGYDHSYQNRTGHHTGGGFGSRFIGSTGGLTGSTVLII